VQRVVSGPLFGRLLREQQRTLRNVRNVGYRMVRADEHNELARGRMRRADKQMDRGLLLLNNVREEEILDPMARQSHQATRMVLSALVQQQRAMERRMQAVEAAIGLRPPPAVE